MAAAGRNDWQRSRPLPPHLQYSSSYDSYYGGPEAPPPSYPGGYGTPRGGPPPPHHPSHPHPQHSPMVSRNSEPADYYYDRPLSPGFGPLPHHSHCGQPYERQPPPPLDNTPYRGRPPPSNPSHRSQMVHRGTPPYSSRGGSVAGATTPRSHPPPHRYVDARHPGGPPSSFFPESPFSPRSRSASSAAPSGPRSRMLMPLHRQHLPPAPRNAGPAPWEPPSPNSELQRKHSKEREHEEAELEKTPTRESSEAEEEVEEEEGNGGDPLALLAKVSSDMETPGSKAKKKGKKHASSAPPCSPLRRTTRTSPVITPTTDNTSSQKRKAEVQIDPSFPEVPPPPRGSSLAIQGPKAVTPMPAYFPHYGEDPRVPPPHHYSAPPSSGYHPYPSHRLGSMPHSWQHHEQDLGPPHPAVVGHSFDSHDSRESYESSSRPPHHRGYYGQPPPQGSYGPPPQQEWSRGPPTPGHPPMSGASMYPMRYTYNGPPPPSRSSEPYAPYSYAQQPHHLEEKTVLRRKFSWKHYPELERFLIAHRDDYLEHSSKNYTAEQKQYNNWLTEQLLAVAEQHRYIFDPEDFNFVSIRDRIRCYYKSYVQTARKRGLELPGKAHIKKHRPANSLDKYAEEKDKRLRKQHGDDEAESDDENEEVRTASKSHGQEAGPKPSAENVK